MRHPVLCRIGLICIAAGSLGAQQGRITSPASGLVFDSGARALRPILGVPGAATIGAPMEFAKDLAAAWVAPRLDSAITVGADGSLRVYRMESGAGSECALEGVAPAPNSVIFSPTGTAALLYSSKGGHVLTGLPDAPKVAGTVDLGSIPRSRPVAGSRIEPQRVSFAISDDGAYVLSSIAGTVRVVTMSGENRKLAEVAADAVVAFAAGSHDAAVADSAAGVVLYRDLALGGAPKAIAPPDGRTPTFSGLAFSMDGRRLFLASLSDRSVTAFDVESGSRSTATCDCAPAGLARMGNVFRLNELGSGPLWLLDPGAAEPRIVFVPAMTRAN